MFAFCFVTKKCISNSCLLLLINRHNSSDCFYRMQHILIMSQRFRRTCIAQIQNKTDPEIFLYRGFIVSFLCLQVLNWFQFWVGYKWAKIYSLSGYGIVLVPGSWRRRWREEKEKDCYWHYGTEKKAVQKEKIFLLCITRAQAICHKNFSLLVTIKCESVWITHYCQSG